MMNLKNFKNDEGVALDSHPQFQQLSKDLEWALERTKSYANSKGAYKNVEMAEKLIEQYRSIFEATKIRKI